MRILRACRRRGAVVGFLLALGLGGLHDPAGAQEPPGKGAEAATAPLQVVATLGVLARLAEEIGGQRVVVQCLASHNQDPHFVRPRPTLMKACRGADLFIELGMDLELWAEKVLDGAGNPRIQRGAPGHLYAALGVRVLERPREVSRAGGDVHPQGNPHVWLDPLNLEVLARNIAQRLMVLDPASRATYEDRLTRFRARLLERLCGAPLVAAAGVDALLDAMHEDALEAFLAERALTQLLGGWLEGAAPLRGRKLVTYHKTWAHFARRFGLEIAIEIEERPGIAPGPRHLERVRAVLRDEKPVAILQAVYYDQQAAQALGRAAACRTIVLPTDVDCAQPGSSVFDIHERILRELLAAHAARNG